MSFFKWFFGIKEKTPYTMLIEQAEMLLGQSTKIYKAAEYQSTCGYSSSAESMRADARRVREEGMQILAKAEELRWKFDDHEPEKEYKDNGKIYR